MASIRTHLVLGSLCLVLLTSCLMLPSPAPHWFYIRVQNRATVCTEGIRIKAPVEFWNRDSDGSLLLTPSLPNDRMKGNFYGSPQKIDFDVTCLPDRSTRLFSVQVGGWNQQLSNAKPQRILVITETSSEPTGLILEATAGRE